MRIIKQQHGDVILEAVDAIPETAKKVEIKDGFVLERGEGVHTHVFPDVEGIEVYEDNGNTYVRVSRPTKIDHEEHGLRTVRPGTYKKRIEAVWDYETEEARKVVD